MFSFEGFIQLWKITVRKHQKHEATKTLKLYYFPYDSETNTPKEVRILVELVVGSLRYAILWPKIQVFPGGQLLFYSTELHITLIVLSRIIKVFLSLSQVLEFIESTPNSRNFVKGEKIINAGHLIFFGLNNQSANQHNILSSAFRDKPHEIKTIIDQNGKIVSSKCSCTAGLSERCKHVTAVLLFCTR